MFGLNYSKKSDLCKLEYLRIRIPFEDGVQILDWDLVNRVDEEFVVCGGEFADAFLEFLVIVDEIAPHVV